jgi:hypothetical protein
MGEYHKAMKEKIEQFTEWVQNNKEYTSKNVSSSVGAYKVVMNITKPNGDTISVEQSDICEGLYSYILSINGEYVVGSISDFQKYHRPLSDLFITLRKAYKDREREKYREDLLNTIMEGLV